MLNIPPELARRYTVLLERRGIAAQQRFHFKKWLRYYLDFCHKYGCDPTDRRSFPAFEDKLRTKRQSEGLRKQAFPCLQSRCKRLANSSCDHATFGLQHPGGYRCGQGGQCASHCLRYGPGPEGGGVIGAFVPALVGVVLVLLIVKTIRRGKP